MRTRRAATGLLLFLQLGYGDSSFVRTIEFTIFVVFDLRKAKKGVYNKMRLTRNERRLFTASVAISLCCCLSVTAGAMHIMEGYLPVGHCVFWGAVCLPFLVWGLLSIKKITTQHRKAVLLLAMMGAYAFVLSALKIPSALGMSSSHPTGTGLGAVMFGAPVMAVLGIIVLLFQAILLAHGGLTTLGANTFSMAIAGPFVSWGVYGLLKRCKVNQTVSIGIACALGDLFTYAVTSVQLGFAHPSEVGGIGASIAEFMGIFAVTQIPLAVIEGILSAVVYMLLQNFAKPELREIGMMQEVR